MWQQATEMGFSKCLASEMDVNYLETEMLKHFVAIFH